MNNFDVLRCLKAVLFLVMGMLLVGTVGLPIIHGEEEELELGYRFLPSKLVENSDVTMYIFGMQDDNVIPKLIEGTRASSLDSSIVRVAEVKSSESGFMSEILLKTGKPGDTIISVVASDFSSIEIPVEVFGNKLSQTQILIKTVPEEFTVNGITTGLVSVQLADEDEFPVIAKKDTIVSLSSSDNSIVQIPQRDLLIKEGEYFAIGSFEVKGEGESKIYASSIGVDSVSTEIDVVDEEELTVELYVYPETLSSYTAQKGHIIAQLQDSGGEPVIAKETIRIDLRIVNDDYTDASNFSDDLYNSIKTVGFFEIPKGSYWGYTTFTPLSGVEDSYDITISSKDPLVIDSEIVETENVELFDDKIVKIETVPILTTGERELIGVMFLEDEDDDPVVADKDIVVRIDSSDEDTLQIENVILTEGSQSAPIYAKVGPSVPADELEIVLLEAEAEIITPDIYGPDEDTLDLVAESLISKILAGTEFPIALYVEETEAEVFPESSNVIVSPSEYFEVDETSVNKGEEIITVNANALKKGSDTLNISIKNYETELTMEGLVSTPTDLELDYSDTIFSGTNDVFSIQLLTDAESPVFASQDTEVQLSLKDSSLIEIPETVLIKKGEYFANFDVSPLSSGSTEISIFGQDLPLKTYDIEITSLKPEISISAPDMIERDDFFDAVITLTHNDAALSDSKVSWNVEGGLVQLSDSKTGADGDASISIIATDPRSITVSADVAGSWYSPTSISKTVKINSTDSEFMAFAEDGQETQYGQIEIFGFDPVLIIVPLGIGLGAFYLKKKGMLQVTQS